MLKRTLALIALIVLVLGSLLGTGTANAGNGNPINPGSADPLTLAVYGDWPYSLDLLTAAPSLITSINADPKVGLVMHVGDIHFFVSVNDDT